jgi:small nuclear ribonucleoprotein (snRNP)-like protein
VESNFFQDLVGKSIEVRLLDEPLYRGKVVSVRGAYVTLTNVEQRATNAWVGKTGEQTFNFNYLLRLQVLG